MTELFAGKMFPTEGHLFVAPFMDDALHTEQFCKANFWYQPSFHGVDLQSLREAAVDEFFVQPIVVGRVHVWVTSGFCRVTRELDVFVLWLLLFGV